MLVVLDSNILIADFPWRSAPFRLLLGELRRRRLQVASLGSSFKRRRTSMRNA